METGEQETGERDQCGDTRTTDGLELRTSYGEDSIGAKDTLETESAEREQEQGYSDVQEHMSNRILSHGVEFFQRVNASALGDYTIIKIQREIENKIKGIHTKHI